MYMRSTKSYNCLWLRQSECWLQPLQFQNQSRFLVGVFGGKAKLLWWLVSPVALIRPILRRKDGAKIRPYALYPIFWRYIRSTLSFTEEEVGVRNYCAISKFLTLYPNKIAFCALLKRKRRFRKRFHLTPRYIRTFDVKSEVKCVLLWRTRIFEISSLVLLRRGSNFFNRIGPFGV